MGEEVTSMQNKNKKRKKKKRQVHKSTGAQGQSNVICLYRCLNKGGRQGDNSSVPGSTLSGVFHVSLGSPV